MHEHALDIVCFDLDKTLLSANLYVDAKSKLKRIKEYGGNVVDLVNDIYQDLVEKKPPKGKTDLESVNASLRDIYQRYKFLPHRQYTIVTPEDLKEKLDDALSRIIMFGLLIKNPKEYFYDFSIEILLNLKNMGKKVAIATNSNNIPIPEFLNEKYGLNIIYIDSAEGFKNKPDCSMGVEILRKIGVLKRDKLTTVETLIRPVNFIMFGDQITDIDFCHNLREYIDGIDNIKGSSFKGIKIDIGNRTQYFHNLLIYFSDQGVIKFLHNPFPNEKKVQKLLEDLGLKDRKIEIKVENKQVDFISSIPDNMSLNDKAKTIAEFCGYETSSRFLFSGKMLFSIKQQNEESVVDNIRRITFADFPSTTLDNVKRQPYAEPCLIL